MSLQMRIPLPGPFSMVANVGRGLGNMGVIAAWMLGIFIMPLVVCLALTAWMGIVIWQVVVFVLKLFVMLVLLPFRR